MSNKETYYQDGNSFYPTNGGSPGIRYPSTVKDYDLEGAKRAAAWFKKAYPEYTLEEGEEITPGVLAGKVRKLCPIDEAQKIALIRYVLEFADDDACAEILDAAKKIVNA